MKKNLLLGLLTLSTLGLAACGTKHYEMSFEDAVNASNNRNQELANLLLNSDYIEQSFNLSSSESENDSSIDINVNSNTKKAIGQMLSEGVLNLALNLKGATNANINGTIETKSVDNNLYLNLSSLEISGAENLASLGSLGDGFKNQRFNIPLSGSFKMIATVKDYLKDLGETRDQNLELYVNEGQETYNGKFTDYNGYNAWKFTLDTDKIKELMQEYYALLISEGEEIPETSIESFEGYLVITDKDEVTTIIENMIIIADDLSISFNSIYGDGIYEINASSQGQDIMSISVKRNKNTYNIICSSPDLIEITGTATPKLDSSKINIDYDLSMVIVADIETKATTPLPLKGSRSLAKIDNFNVEAPADAIDLLTLIEGYLGGYSLEPSDYDEETAEIIENNGDEEIGQTTGIANPASVYCEENGGVLSIEKDEGGEHGVCTFPNGKTCEERAFFRGECTTEEMGQTTGIANPASVYCEENGGVLSIERDESGEHGVCTFPNGKTCEERAFFRGECTAE